MKFQDYATQKAAALIAELSATWSEKSARELQAFQKALETAAHAAQTALATASSSDERYASVAALVEQLTGRGSGPGRSRRAPCARRRTDTDRCAAEGPRKTVPEPGAARRLGSADYVTRADALRNGSNCKEPIAAARDVSGERAIAGPDRSRRRSRAPSGSRASASMPIGNCRTEGGRCGTRADRPASRSSSRSRPPSAPRSVASSLHRRGSDQPKADLRSSTSS